MHKSSEVWLGAAGAFFVIALLMLVINREPYAITFGILSGFCSVCSIYLVLNWSPDEDESN